MRKAYTTVKIIPREISQLLATAIREAQLAGDLTDFDVPDITVTASEREGHGDYASPVALSLAKPARMKPRLVAETIVKHLPSADIIVKVDIAGPGFINFDLSKEWLRQQVENIILEGEDLFRLPLGNGKKAQVEFVSANPSGPITIGRSRGGIIGDTMARLLEAAGYEVQREYYFNNAGQQMIMLGQSLKARYLQELGHVVDLPEGGYQGTYLIDYAKDLISERGDSMVDEDWQPFKEYAEKRNFEWIRSTLARINVYHDAFFNEDTLFQSNAIWAVLEQLERNGHIYRAAEWEGASEEEMTAAANKAPAVWLRTTTFDDEKDRVMVKSDGVPTYTLPDIAYHQNKIERGFDIMVNVLGADHGQQYKVVQMGLRALGLDPSGIHVIINQMVRAVRRNSETGKMEEIKYSTRRGVIDALDDLIDETGPDAIRYHMLARSPSSHLNFNVEDVVKQSNENPVYYIQNAHVRCCGILREADARDLTYQDADLSPLGDEELRFIRKAIELGEIIDLAVTNYEPHKIAFWAQDLAAVFHPIYDNVRAIGEGIPVDVTQARLRFYKAAQVVFRRVLSLMGMNAPERM